MAVAVTRRTDILRAEQQALLEVAQRYREVREGLGQAYADLAGIAAGALEEAEESGDFDPTLGVRAEPALAHVAGVEEADATAREVAYHRVMRSIAGAVVSSLGGAEGAVTGVRSVGWDPPGAGGRGLVVTVSFASAELRQRALARPRIRAS